MCLRLMLDFCDNIIAHGRGCCGLNDACRLWCLSFRFVRDAIVGLILLLVLFVLSLIPGLRSLHSCFLFRVSPSKENREQLLDSGGGRSTAGPEDDPINFL